MAKKYLILRRLGGKSGGKIFGGPYASIDIIMHTLAVVQPSVDWTENVDTQL